MCVCTYTWAHTPTSEDNLEVSFLSLSYVGPEYWTHIVRLGGSPWWMLRHISTMPRYHIFSVAIMNENIFFCCTLYSFVAVNMRLNFVCRPYCWMSWDSVACYFIEFSVSTFSFACMLYVCTAYVCACAVVCTRACDSKCTCAYLFMWGPEVYFRCLLLLLSTLIFESGSFPELISWLSWPRSSKYVLCLLFCLSVL